MASARTDGLMGEGEPQTLCVHPKLRTSPPPPRRLLFLRGGAFQLQTSDAWEDGVGLRQESQARGRQMPEEGNLTLSAT